MKRAKCTPAPEPQQEVLAFLSDGSAFGETVPPERIDTHAASIFLVGDKAWKLKRAVRFDYLDFSTADLRRSALDAELRLNCRTAPTLYRGIHAITRDRNGRLAIDGTGKPVDWLLEMRRFPSDGLFDHLARAGRLDTHLLMRLTARLVAFHAGAKEATQLAGAVSFRRIIEGNRVSMAAFPSLLDQDLVQHLATRLFEAIDEEAPLLDERARTGRVRHGHGDLHLANIALVDGEPTLFDCLEFSADLATIDVLYDLAFLLMDLWQRGMHTEANVVFNRYLDLSPADETGVRLMPLFLSTRAMIRAHVVAAESQRTCDSGAEAEAARFLELALDLLASARTRLVAIGGLSGTGKSSLARELGGMIGRAPGARVIRSDILRKRLAGTAPEVRLPAEYYSDEMSGQIYAMLMRDAAAALAVGQSVIADAVFARPEEREAIATTAREADVSFTGFWLEMPFADRVERLLARGVDASDADVPVAARQELFAVGDLQDWHRLSASGKLADIAGTVNAVVDSTAV